MTKSVVPNNVNIQTITLKVTSKVIDYAQDKDNQKQIAITSVEGSLSEIIKGANRANPIWVELSSGVGLSVGDTSAIWFSHNVDSPFLFTTLYSFLSAMPDKEFTYAVNLTEN